MPVPAALLLVLTIVAWSGSPWAAEQRLRVLGSTSLSGQIARAEGERLRLEGQLTDDAGAPVSEAEIEVEGPTGLRDGAAPCVSGETLGGSGQRVRLRTDGQGKICLLLRGSVEGSSLRLSFRDPSGFLSESQLELALVPAPGALELQLAAPLELPLEADKHLVEVIATPRATDASAPPEIGDEALEIPVLLEAPHREPLPLGEVRVRPGERGRLEVRARDLGEPGAAVLVARFEGNDRWAAAEARRHVSRTALATISVPSPPALDPERLPVELEARVLWERGHVPSGTIEALLGSHRLGAGAVTSGRARIALDMSEELLDELARRGALSTPLPVTLTYVPTAPWWRPGPATLVELPWVTPEPWQRVPWVLGVAALLLWIALVWRRPRGRTRSATQTAAEPPGRASLEIVARTENGNLLGQVLDAHTGSPVTRASVEVLLPGVETARTLARVEADDEGRFELDASVVQEDRGATPRLKIGAPDYSALDRPLPKGGHLVIHLVTTRRAILGRLVNWARRRGTPWGGPLPPTPAHVAHIAEGRREEATARWARDVETAVFGPENPTEETERALQRQEPG